MTATDDLLAEIAARDSVRGREFLGFAHEIERNDAGQPVAMYARPVYFKWPLDRSCGDDE